MQKLFQLMGLGVFAASTLLSAGVPSAQAASLCEDPTELTAGGEYSFLKGSEVVSAVICGSDRVASGGVTYDQDFFVLPDVEAETLDFQITLSDPADAGKLYYAWEYYGGEGTLGYNESYKPLNNITSYDTGDYELLLDASTVSMSFPSDLGLASLDQISNVILYIYSYSDEDIAYEVEFIQDGVAVKEPTEEIVPTGDLRIDSFTYENGIASLEVSTDLDTIVLPEGVSVVAHFYAVDPADSTSKILIGRRVLNKKHEDFLTPGVSRTFHTNLYSADTSYERKMSTLLEGSEYKLVVQLSVKNLEQDETLTSSYDVNTTDASNFARIKGLVVREGRLQ